MNRQIDEYIERKTDRQINQIDRQNYQIDGQIDRGRKKLRERQNGGRKYRKKKEGKKGERGF